jgi:hypothetical protein
MLLAAIIYGTIGATCVRSLWRVCKIVLFGPLFREYPPRPDRCPNCPEGWS